MTPAMISDLARQIAQQQLHEGYLYYLILLALLFVGAFFGSYIQGFASDKGKAKSMQSNFDMLSEQLKKTTSLTTEIQIALNHDDWSSKEYKVLRRNKLEILTFALYETRDWASTQITVGGANAIIQAESSPVNKVYVTSKLYFPELNAVNLKFHKVHQKFIVEFLNAQNLYSKTKLVHDQLSMRMDAYLEMKNAEKVQETEPQLDAARAELRNAYSEFSKSVIPVYHELQDSLLNYETMIQDLMLRTISPITRI
jgi:hypothetical protein